MALAPTSVELEPKSHSQIENLERDIKHVPPGPSSPYGSLGAAVCSPLRLGGPEHMKQSDCAFVSLSLSLCPGEGVTCSHQRPFRSQSDGGGVKEERGPGKTAVFTCCFLLCIPQLGESSRCSAVSVWLTALSATPPGPPVPSRPAGPRLRRLSHAPPSRARATRVPTRAPRAAPARAAERQDVT